MKQITNMLVAVALVLPSCRSQTPQDHVPPPRIVSYSPALTNLLYEMHLGDHVVGVTNFCRPPGQTKPPAVGDAARVSAEAILAVKPDVLLIQQNPDAFGAVRSIAPKIRIEHFKIETLKDVAEAIERIGRIVGRADLGEKHKKAFLSRFRAVQQRVANRPRVKVLFVIGYDRPSTGGKGTFIDQMIRLAGGLNAATERGYVGWKRLNRENILAMAPEHLVCQVGPDQEQDAQRYWQSLPDLPAVKNHRVSIVTGQSWTIPSISLAEYTSRLAEIIHPSEGQQGAMRD